MSADSLTDDHASRSEVITDITSAAAGVVNSPLPWASVVRGDSEPISSPTAAIVVVDIPRSSLTPQSIAAVTEESFASEKGSMENSGPVGQPESADTNNYGNAGSPKRPAWKKPINGVVDPGSIMGGAVSWPALSESIRPVSRSSDSSRPFSDGSPSSSQGPEISQPLQRQANSHANANVTANHSMPARQRPMGHRGRGGGGMNPRNGPSPTGFSSPSPSMPPPFPPPFPLFDMPYGTVVPPVRPMGGVRGPQLHTTNDHSLHRNNSRRGNFGQRPRGDGPNYNNHGGRRDQNRRDVRLSHQYIPPPPIGFMHPPGAAPFIRHPHVGFDMASPMIYYPTLPPVSLVPPPPPPLPPMPSPAVVDTLPTLIVKQINYYFSDNNLDNDHFLRGNMDAEGWVPISLIASFPRVKKLTSDIQMILDSLRASTVVEVQGDKIRKREWKEYLNKKSNRLNANSGSQPPDASVEKSVATSFQKVSLDGPSTNVNTSVQDLTGHTVLANGEIAKDIINSLNI